MSRRLADAANQNGADDFGEAAALRAFAQGPIAENQGAAEILGDGESDRPLEAHLTAEEIGRRLADSGSSPLTASTRSRP